MKVDVSTRFSSYLFALLSLLFCRLSCFPTPFPFSCTHSEKCFLIWQQLSADIKNDKLIKKWIYQAALQLINGSALSRLFAWSPLQLHCPSFLPLLEMYPSFPPFFFLSRRFLLCVTASHVTHSLLRTVVPSLITRSFADRFGSGNVGCKCIF